MSLLSLQAAVYAALTAGSPEYPTFAHVPQDTAYPYVVMGAWTGLPDGALDEADALDATLTLHGWSGYHGPKEALEIADWIRGRLHHQEIAGAWTCYEEFAEVFAEGEGDDRLYHLVVRYRIRT